MGTDTFIAHLNSIMHTGQEDYILVWLSVSYDYPFLGKKNFRTTDRVNCGHICSNKRAQLFVKAQS